jgi:23S rRNA (guanine745-N1)-methyltransferase
LPHIKTLYFKETKTLSTKEDILSLLAMTPHYWRCTLEKKQYLESLSELRITVDIQFDIFSKK